MIRGGEPELARLLDEFAGVEEVDGGYAVYGDTVPDGFELLDARDVEPGWEDRWRAFHHGVQVGRFWVGPPWELRQGVASGADAVVIDPGRAFGTGAHPTTRLTLELLQELEPVGALLDVGCGSGVLSIAAAKLGFAPVTGVDVDPAAIEATLANAAVNDVTVEAHVADALADELPPADVAVANVALEVVEALLPRLRCRAIVTSGYLDRDRPRVPGWMHADRRERDGWAADLLTLPA